MSVLCTEWNYLLHFLEDYRIYVKVTKINIKLFVLVWNIFVHVNIHLCEKNMVPSHVNFLIFMFLR